MRAKRANADQHPVRCAAAGSQAAADEGCSGAARRPDRPLEVAATLRASPVDTFFSVVLPLARPGFITACILTFAHTVGEFGVVLMIGGNIPGVSRVASVQIYDYVEAMEYADAHRLAAVMLSPCPPRPCACHARLPAPAR